MKRAICGIALLLFAILLQLSSTGMELVTLGLGIIGLILTFVGGLKAE